MLRIIREKSYQRMLNVMRNRQDIINLLYDKIEQLQEKNGKLERILDLKKEVEKNRRIQQVHDKSHGKGRGRKIRPRK